MTGDAPIDLVDVPEVARRFRLQFEPAPSAWVLLYPEGMVRLSDSAAAILQRLDGRRNVDALMRDLERAYPGADVRQDVLDFLETARDGGWITTRR
jgi:pyrroloquinoline quinone biosynthesis protein D